MPHEESGHVLLCLSGAVACGLFAAGSVGHTALPEALQCPKVHNSQSSKWKPHRSSITSQNENEKDPYTK